MLVMLQIYDTTLRDGTQRKGISLSAVDKIRIAKRLDDLGVAFIEGGWPGSNPKDIEFFNQASKIEWKNAVITAFGSTCRVNGQPAEDANIKALLEANTQVCTIVGKSWDLHVSDVLQTTPEENLRIIEESSAYLVSQGKRVMFDAEHFFDGYKANPEFAIDTLRAAEKGMAEIAVLCDTNGGCMPWEMTEIVRAVKAAVNIPLGIHVHNDGELAVANSIMAIQASCIQVQGTINGYGERCGNANLCSIIPNLELKLGLQCLPEGKLKELYEVSHFVTEVANLPHDNHLPYIGSAAFAHKGGIHVAAMRRNVDSYQHINPELVGNQMEVVVSELSGRGNLLSKAEEIGLDVSKIPNTAGVLNEIKEMESRGFSFEAAEASVGMMLKRTEQGYQPPYELVDFMVNVEHRQGRGILAEATVKIKVNGEVQHTAAEGNGPVDALDKAMRKALITHYPQITKFQLSDYKVRILDGVNGTQATTRVLIDTKNGTKQWSTVGASANIIEASWQALSDSFEYGLMVAK
jgi:2-isopropylmalate synthase